MSIQYSERQISSIQNVAHRDQLAAALRDADTAVTAKDLGKRVGFTTFANHDLSEPGIACETGGGWWSHYDGDIDIHIMTMGHVASHHLPALQRAGLAGRTKVGRSVYWAWTGEPVDMASIEHLDFSAPSEVDIVMEDLAALGAEIELVADPAKSEGGRVFAGSIEWRRNGPVQYFRIELWEKAAPEKQVEALRQAASLIRSPSRFENINTGLCLGSPVAVGGEA